MKSPRQCLDCGRDKTLEEWYPEMLCETCEQEIDSAFMERKQTGRIGVSR